MHAPQSVHFSASTVGALLPSCESAPVGHTFTDGQGWFCGHLDSIIVTGIFLVSPAYSFLNH